MGGRVRRAVRWHRLAACEGRGAVICPSCAASPPSPGCWAATQSDIHTLQHRASKKRHHAWPVSLTCHHLRGRGEDLDWPLLQVRLNCCPSLLHALVVGQIVHGLEAACEGGSGAPNGQKVQQGCRRRSGGGG